jgi:ribosomal protein S18 acetylase RimI-like enzyme
MDGINPTGCQGKTMTVNNDLVVRVAELGDARQIAEVHVRVWQAAYRGLIPKEHLTKLSVEEREAFWTGILSKDERDVFVLTDQGPVVGWAASGPARDQDCDPARVQEVYGIYLLEACWGRGFGKRLYLAAERQAEMRADEIVLWVLEPNMRARRFYERLGFRIEAGRKLEKPFCQLTLPVVRYRKRLVRA